MSFRLDSLRRRTHFDTHAVTHLQHLLIALLHVGQESLGIVGEEMHLAEIEDLREQVGIDLYSRKGLVISEIISRRLSKTR